jgi:hypothetical protein
MMGDPRSFPAPPEIYEKYEAMLDEMGVSKGDNPAIDMPDWIEDTRN